MKRLRVLVVDDSVVIRRLITHALETDPDIEVVGFAANGQLALARIAQTSPDAVTLDVEMPVMDGITTLKALRKDRPRLPVIMVSTLTHRGASVTLDALSAGASDYVAKPEQVESAEAASAQFRDELIPKIKALCARNAQVVPSSPPPQKIQRRPRNREMPIDIVAIGSSAGGPNALAEVIPKLPRDLPVPVLLVQHMPPLFTQLLAERLSTEWGNPFEEAKEGARLEPGCGYIAPGGRHVTLARRGGAVTAHLNVDPPENSCRPAVDVMLRSVAAIYGDRTLAVILTGMGQDGLKGCQAVVSAGGRVFAQDEATSVVWGMPGYVVHAGLAEEVIPIQKVAARITEAVIGSRASRHAGVLSA